MFEPAPNPATGAGAWLRSARDRLEAVGIESASLDARMLLLDGLKLPHSVIVADPNLALNPEEITQLEAMLDRRLQREPVSRILGWREFYGRKFQINHQVLDPRPDTEVLVDTALARIDEQFGPEHPCRFLDVGTGSGCIAVSLLAERPAWRSIATDLSAEALATARQNAETHKVIDRLELVETSWGEGIAGPFDLVVSNPPYIPAAEIGELMPEVRDHDPHLALAGGGDGLQAYRELFAAARGLMAGGGLLIVEIGESQADSARAAAVDAALLQTPDECDVVTDLAGRARVLVLPVAGGKA